MQEVKISDSAEIRSYDPLSNSHHTWLLSQIAYYCFIII